jgi:hypothetical protein
MYAGKDLKAKSNLSMDMKCSEQAKVKTGAAMNAVGL